MKNENTFDESKDIHQDVKDITHTINHSKGEGCVYKWVKQ